MTIIKKLVIFTFSITMALSALSLCVFAENDKQSVREIYSDTYGKTLCAARKGYTEFYPENSLNAVKSAVENGADIVEIDIKVSSDGIPVLMCDDTVTRTCVDYGEKTAVSEMIAKDITSLHLLSGEGGHGAVKTEETVPMLSDILSNDNGDIMYLLDCSWRDRDVIYNTVSECGKTDSVIFLMCDAKTDEIAQWKNSLDIKPEVMTYFKGNIIFSAISHINKSVDGSFTSTYLATKVPYGVVFSKTVMEKAEGKIRAMANTTDGSYCGGIREDTEVWWNDLISRGYSIILTDYVPELREYIDNCETKREKLTKRYNELVENWTLPNIKSDVFLDYKRAYNNAATLSESLIKDKSSSAQDLDKAYYELQKAYDDINSNYEEIISGTAGVTITPLRIIICILAVAAVITAEIFVYRKKRKKTD